MRINQYLARSGLGSRRKVEALIQAGLVTMNGKVVTELATEVNAGKDTVLFKGTQVVLPELKYFMLNKPKGYTVTRDDAHAERTVFELLPPDKSLISVGRLDRDTTGLLIITNDGQFAQNIIHPSEKVEKEYYIRTKTPITGAECQNLIAGVHLDDGLARANNVRRISDCEIALSIEEGRNRIVRRMISAVGNNVLELRRDRIGMIKLDIEEGGYRALTAKELKSYA